MSGVLLTALKRIWVATDQMCSKKLKAALPLWLPFYDSAYEPLPANLQVRPQPLPLLKLTVPPAPVTPASATLPTG